MKQPPHKARLLRILFAFAIVSLLAGCSWEGAWENIVAWFELRTLVTFFTAGTVATYERNLMLITLGIMMFVLLPVVILTLGFAWRYRASNQRATYDPNWHSSHLLEIFLWAGPIAIILVLATMTWISTFHLDPYKALHADREPVEIQAIAMDWKWLFIYPEYDVATINEMGIPVDTPISIDLTSATVMNAFMIPRLGSQIFAMSGMRTQLHLDATEPGSYYGKNYQYSGKGFHNMNFQAVALPRAGFEKWLARVKSSDRVLDMPAFETLVQASAHDRVTYYSDVAPDLFSRVMAEFNDGDGRDYQPHKRTGH